MKSIARWIVEIIREVKGNELPEDRMKRNEILERFKQGLNSNKTVKRVRSEVVQLCKRFPLYPELFK